MTISDSFPSYTQYAPAVPVRCVTPDLPGCFHRFFDTSPVSPSGRFLALTRFEPADRMPEPGEPAEVVLVDLEEGETRILTRTFGWDTQLGAQVQWGTDDSELFYNDMDVRTWTPCGVKANILTGESVRLDGTIYMVSPDGTRALSPCLLRTGCTQAGYGVLAPREHVPRNRGAVDDDGVYITDCRTGTCRLLLSFRQIALALFPATHAETGDFYGFHLKWNPQGTRVMMVVRWKPHDGSRIQPTLVTFRPDGSELAVSIPASEWAVKGGHHPNWCPNGTDAMMNLKIDGPMLRFVRARCDGADLRTMSDTIVGSGHPSRHPGGRHVVTDSYLGEPVSYGDGTTPIRWADLQSGTVRDIVRIRTRPPYDGPKRERRVDPHPAWNRSWSHIAFNGCPDGIRRVYLADLTALL